MREGDETMRCDQKSEKKIRSKRERKREEIR